MNFLMQSATAISADATSISSDTNYNLGPVTTLEGLIAMAEDNSEEDTNGEHATTKTDTPIVENYIDMSEDEGWVMLYLEPPSFILKPTTYRSKTTKVNGVKSYSQVGSSPSVSSNFLEGNRNADQFTVLVSCRCNYTESKLFFKQPTSWQPRISRDMMISVASEMSRQNPSSNGSVTQLPVQVLTLQASNLTSEDLTLTVLAPASVTSPPSVLPLNSAPSTPSVLPLNATFVPQTIPYDEKKVPTSDVLPTTDLGCTHLWLQSSVPLGCVPSQSTTTIKLELLPLTDGIITLDSLQINVKEKGMTYIPEHSLKINATSSIASGII